MFIHILNTSRGAVLHELYYNWNLAFLFLARSFTIHGRTHRHARYLVEYSYVPVCQSYVLVCYSYVTRIYSYVTCVDRMLLVCYPYVLVCYSYVLVCTSMSLVCHSCCELVTIPIACLCAQDKLSITCGSVWPRLLSATYNGLAHMVCFLSRR